MSYMFKYCLQVQVLFLLDFLMRGFSQAHHVMCRVGVPVVQMVSGSYQIAAFKFSCDFLFYSLVRKLSSQTSFSVILYKNLSTFWVNNSRNFINDLQHCEVFAVGQPLTFLYHNKISSCTFIVFIMSKIHFSFIEELKSKHRQREYFHNIK